MSRKECVVIKLLSPSKRKLLLLDTYQNMFQAGIQLANNFAREHETANRNIIHHGCYYQIRALGLPSDYARMVIYIVVSSATSHFGKQKSKHFKTTSWPTFKKKHPIGIGCNAYKLINKKSQWVLRLSTGKKGTYIWLPLCVPKHYESTLTLARGDALLYQRNNDWFIQLPTRYPAAKPSIHINAPFFGVDLGIAKIATLVGPDTVKFWSSKAVQDKRRQFQRYRTRMQRKGRLDKVRTSKGKESRWQKDVNHKISRELVDIVAKTPNSVISLEKLDGIRSRVRGSKRFNRMMGNWAFRQLADMIVYKAARKGIPIVWVDPRKTSQTCSRCGHATRANRPDQAHFKCVSCGFQANSDYNASVNISRKGAITASYDAPTGMARAS